MKIIAALARSVVKKQDGGGMVHEWRTATHGRRLEYHAQRTLLARACVPDDEIQTMRNFTKRAPVWPTRLRTRILRAERTRMIAV